MKGVAHIIVSMKPEGPSLCCKWDGVVRPKASASVSKHCVPVHTVARCRVSMTSCRPSLASQRGACSLVVELADSGLTLGLGFRIRVLG